MRSLTKGRAYWQTFACVMEARAGGRVLLVCLDKPYYLKLAKAITAEQPGVELDLEVGRLGITLRRKQMCEYRYYWPPSLHPRLMVGRCCLPAGHREKDCKVVEIRDGVEYTMTNLQTPCDGTPCQITTRKLEGVTDGKIQSAQG
jgi:hypothetical protein